MFILNFSIPSSTSWIYDADAVFEVVCTVDICIWLFVSDGEIKILIIENSTYLALTRM
jgi:hypothetical protein